VILDDFFYRKIDYLRISLTDRCNLSCFYCTPCEGIGLYPKSQILTIEEIKYLVYFFKKNSMLKNSDLQVGSPL